MYEKVGKVISLYSSKPLDKKFAINVQAQVDALSKASFLEVTGGNRGFINSYTGDKATNKKYDDLNFRHIGEEEYKLRISYFILKQASVNANIELQRALY